MANIGDFIKGDKELVATLQALRRSVTSQIMKPAINEGLKIVSNEAKNLATPGNVLSEQATGWMRKAIKYISRVSRDGLRAIGKVFVSKKMGDYVVSRDDHKDWIGKRWSVMANDWADRPAPTIHYHHNPGMVAHLVEFGHGGPHPAPAHPFMRPAIDNTKEESLEVISNKAKQLFPIVVAEAKTKSGSIWK